MTDNCPVCKSDLIPDNGQYPPKTGDRQHYECPQCGGYSLSRSIADDLASILKNDNKKIAILSHAICKMQRNQRFPYLDSYLVELILQNSLPSLTEQINNLILWLGEKTSPGKTESLHSSTHRSIIGAMNLEGFVLVVKHLIDTRLIEGNPISNRGIFFQVDAALTFDGWNYFDQLNRGAMTSRKAFMAMKFGDAELDWILNQCFKPAVAATGFELYRLDEVPKAGLIDDRLRVEIRTSRFLISDLTHENAGAYWEAGYAEGLGKPVIYTCKKNKFESQKTHFDTNHHLTVIWDKDQPELAIDQLKAIIRATLPDEAKLTDA
jgi:hypothetical protein